MCPKQLKYSSEICDQTGCHLNTKPIGVESCMAHVCYNAANVAVAIFKFLLKNNLVGHKTKLVGHVSQCAPAWLRHWMAQNMIMCDKCLVWFHW